MNTELVDIAGLMVDPGNARRHGKRNLDAIRASLLRFGQQKPIVVDAAGVVVAGNGTLEAARAIGWEKIAVVRTELADGDRQAFAIADNRTAELAEWDDEALAKALAGLQNQDGIDHLAAGFTDEEITRLLAGIVQPDYEPDPAAEWQGMPECQQEDETPVRSIHVHFKSLADVQDFGTRLGQCITDKTRSMWFPGATPADFSKQAYTSAT